MSAQNNLERQKAYRKKQQELKRKQKDPIYQEAEFITSRAANISPFVQFAISLRELYKQHEIDNSLIEKLIATAMERVEEDENILVARSLKRRMEEFIADRIDYHGDNNMKFYIYRNWVAEKKAVIHRADCSYCNNGKGLQKNIHDDKNGAWSKSYDTYDEAKKAANESYNGYDLMVRDCAVCLKNEN